MAIEVTLPPQGLDQAALRLSLLGGFRAERAGRVISDVGWERPSGKTLVKLLATFPGHRLHREEALDLLWPDLAPDSAAASLRKALHYARHALEPELPAKGQSQYLTLHDDLLALTGSYSVDADDFENLAQHALQSGRMVDYAAALATYRGELLPEDRYAEWAISRREHLASLHLRVLMGTAAELEQRGAYGEAVSRLSLALCQDPCHEEAHRRLIHLYARMGSRHEALRQYQMCREALRRELGVEPEGATQELYEEIVSGRLEVGVGIDQYPPLPPAIRRGNLIPFVGRERALHLLRTEQQSVEAGSGRLLLVGGETGVGKTRLAEELAREAQQQGTLVLWGAAYQQEGHCPYGPLVEAIDGYLSRLSSARLLSLRDAFPELAPLFPLLGQTKPVSDAPTEQATLFRAIARLLTQGASQAPLLLVLDDLQWADAGSIELLSYLARMAQDQPWLLLGTYREEDVGPGSPLQQFLATAAHRHLGRRIVLLRLSRVECLQLVQATLSHPPSAQLLDHLFALSQGNPLFLQELLDSLQEREALTLVDGWWEIKDLTLQVPPQIRDLVAVRVDHLEPGVRRILSLAAVLGADVSFAVIREAAHALGDGASDGAVLDALDQAIEAHVMEESEGDYAFRHPLFRATIYDRLPSARRRYLHGAAARAIEALYPNDVDQLAHHYVCSDEREKAAEYLEMAADRAAAIYANETAEAYYREALSLLAALGESQRAMRASEKLGSVLLLRGRYGSALEILEHVVREYRERDDLDGLARSTETLGWLHMRQGTPTEGLSVIGPLIARLVDVADMSSSLTALHTVRASLLWLAGRHDEAQLAAEEGVRLALTLRDGRASGRARAWLGLSLCTLGQVEAGRRELEEARRLGEVSGDAETLVLVLNNLGAIYANAADAHQAICCLEQGLVLAERQGDPAQEVFIAAQLGSILVGIGDWERGRHVLERAGAIRHRVDSAASSYYLCHLGDLHLMRGDRERGVSCLQEAITHAQTIGDPRVVPRARAMLARQELVDGHPQEALAQVDLDPAEFHGTGPDLVLRLVVAAEAHLELRNLEEADRLVTQAIKRATEQHMGVELIDARRVQAQLAWRRQRPDEAITLFEQAIQTAQALPCPYGEAHALLACGRMLAEMNEIAPAAEKLEAARRIFDRLGAVPAARRAGSVLNSLSRPPAQTPLQ